MEIITSKQCESLTGSIGRHFGYHIQHRKNGFFGKRNSKGYVPPDGHLRFIIACAQLAYASPYFEDIKVGVNELWQALIEAHEFTAANNLKLAVYHARDIINLKTTFGL